MFNKLHYIHIAICYMVIVTVVLFTSSLNAQEALQNSFSNDRYGISLTVPGDLKIIDNSNTGALLLLKSAKNDYPTFNILSQSGSYPNSRKIPSELAEAVVADYHRVGLTTAELLSFRETTIKDAEVLQIKISFENGGIPLISLVIIIPRGDEHLICTYIDNADTYDSNFNIYKKLFESIKITNSSDTEKKNVSSSKLSFILVLSLAVLFLLLAGWLLRALFLKRD